jgi:hypothetical protein
MSISFYGYIRDDTGWTWPEAMRDRLDAETPPAPDSPDYAAWMDGDPAIEAACRNPHYDPRLDVNLSDLNARLVLCELGFLRGITPVCIYDIAPLPIEIFEIGLRATMARNSDPIPGFEGYDTHGQLGCRMISPGTPDGYANRVFERLLTLVEAAKEYGATHLGWG